MEDEEIVTLYLERAENAIKQTEEKYGSYCIVIANNILSNNEDSKECVNESYFKVWNCIPPKVPKSFKAFLGAIVRNTALQMFRNSRRKKRWHGEMPLVLEELEECIASQTSVEKDYERKELVKEINNYLATLKPEIRTIFLQRYWFSNSIADIAKRYNMSESKVKSVLFRQRKKLGEYLEGNISELGSDNCEKD